MAERLLALAVLVGSGAYLLTASALPVGTPARPGPGFYPLAVGGFGVVVALAWLAVGVRRTAGGAGAAAPTPRDARGRVLATGGLLFGFCLALPWVGYPLSAFAFVSAMLRALGMGWAGAAAIGVLSALASYYLFGPILGVPLPRGPLMD